MDAALLIIGALAVIYGFARLLVIALVKLTEV